MSIAHTLSTSFVANGGFGDPDLTPKPLRISKREQAGTSKVGTVDSSLSIRKSQTHRNLQALAPSKRPSTRVNSTQLDLSLQGLAAPTSSWARRNTFLHVHKQRQSEPIIPNTAALTAISKEPIGFSSFNLPARSRDSGPAMSQLGSGSDASRAINAARPVSKRAFTSVTYRRENPLSPVHEVSSSPSASPALRGGQRRAVSNAEVFYKDLNAIGSLPHCGLRKQHSSKNSLISRVMSGLTNRAHGSHAGLRDRNDAAQIPLDSPPATPSRARPHEETHASRKNDASTETDTYCGSDLHDALAAFPTPPASNTTSSTTPWSPKSRPSIRSERFRDLCTPADTVLMGVELTLTPEYDQLSSEKGRSMLVSLDIKGTTNSASSVQDVWSQHTGLDMVVVIDNSLHTSPATLMAICETARVLASISNKITDRLAIICTSSTGTSGANSRIVRGLSAVKKHEIKSSLDAITSSMERPKTNAWTDTIDCAKELLLKSKVPDPDEEPLEDTFGHIFILTPDTDGLPFQSLTHEQLTFHIISPAGTPKNEQSPIHCNGWKLRSLSGNETQAVSTKKDLDPMSVPNQLRILIPQARSGKLLGSLTELVLEVSAGPDCIVEGVIGKVNFTELHPGEVFTVLFKLRVGAATEQGYSLSRNSTRSSEALPNTKDILSQLDKLLGTTDAEILTARLTYKNSLLPAGTTCSITAECQIKRRLPDPYQKPSLSKYNSHQVRDCTVLVQKRLAYHLATHGSPRNALATLYSEFDVRAQLSACPDYIKILVKELKYQARIVQRLEIDASPKKFPAVHAANSPFGRHGQGSFDAEKYKPQQSATSDIPTEDLFKPKPALAVLSVKESREQLRTDEARKIWGDLRKMNRPPNQSVKGRSVSSQLEEARKEGIRELAVKNKRSLGSDTLRSIFSGGENTGKGLGAPWM